MNWRPITLEALNLIIQISSRSLPPDLLDIFQSTSIDPMRIPCIRGEAVEQVFVIATSKNKLILFDDVEDEFGVSACPQVDNPIRDWEIFPDLESAFRSLL